MTPRLSVLFATHNGARWIERVLDAFVAQGSPVPWQLVVVDNNSTDGTPEIVARYRDTLPLTLLHETRMGKNRALNTGLAAVSGELVVLTDDDAPPRPGCLAAWASLIDSYPEYSLIGGRVTAEFDAPPPRWIRRLMRVSSAVFAQRDLPTGPVAADEIFGPNMCVRRRVFDAGMRFDETIGPNGGDANYPMGSETEFCRRAEAAGYRAMFFADAEVGHIVRPHQMTAAYFKTVAFRAGRRDAITDARSGGLSHNLWSHRPLRRHTPVPVQAIVLRLRAWFAIDPVARNRRWWRYHWWRGYMSEARSARPAAR